MEFDVEDLWASTSDFSAPRLGPKYVLHSQIRSPDGGLHFAFGGSAIKGPNNSVGLYVTNHSQRPLTKSWDKQPKMLNRNE